MTLYLPAPKVINPICKFQPNNHNFPLRNTHILYITTQIYPIGITINHHQPSYTIAKYTPEVTQHLSKPTKLLCTYYIYTIYHPNNTSYTYTIYRTSDTT